MHIVIQVEGKAVARFNPQPDITSYELSLCMPFIVMKGSGFFRFFSELPDTAKKHFDFFVEEYPDMPVLKECHDIVMREREKGLGYFIQKEKPVVKRKVDTKKEKKDEPKKSRAKKGAKRKVSDTVRKGGSGTRRNSKSSRAGSTKK